MKTLLGSRARWAAPSGRSSRFLGLACAAVVATGAWIGWSLLGTPSRAVTLAAAYDFLPGPLRLFRAQDAAWRLAVQDGGGLVVRTDALLAPSLPPALCATGIAGPGDGPEAVAVPELDRHIRRAERAIATRDRPALALGADALRRAGGGLAGDEAVVARYALARVLAAGDDLGAAARWLEGLTLTAADGGGLPIVTAAMAARIAGAEGVDRAHVLLAFHSRYLAGVVAYRRDRPVEAIGHFRRALNAVNYLLAEGGDWRRGGHFERIDMSPDILSCGAAAGSGFSSLDAYAGLVAAYMAAPGFRDPRGLVEEVSRRGSQVDPNDPLTPLLVHAQEVAGQRTDSPIPEHVLWAASNLQRVYHYNRLRPDPRLAVTRAVLTLRVLDDSVWTGALGLGEDERCDMLAEVAVGLRQDGVGMGAPGSPLARADSAWAAVAVHTFARLDSRCPDLDTGVTDEAVRGQMLGLAGDLLHSGLVARYEGWRRVLEDGGVVAGADTAARVLERAASDSRFFGSGRVPPDMSAGIDPATGAAFVDAWWRAVFRDVADQLVGQVEGGAAMPRILARDAGPYLRTVNAAVAHAGLRPVDAYRPEALQLLTRSQGDTGVLLHGVRYRARSFPWVTAGSVALLTLCGLAVAVIVFVNCWRFALLTRTCFYGKEAEQREGAEPERPSTAGTQ